VDGRESVAPLVSEAPKVSCNSLMRMRQGRNKRTPMGAAPLTSGEVRQMKKEV